MEKKYEQTTTKKTTTTTKKATPKKEEMKVSLHIQYAGKNLEEQYRLRLANCY